MELHVLDIIIKPKVNILNIIVVIVIVYVSLTVLIMVVQKVSIMMTMSAKRLQQHTMNVQDHVIHHMHIRYLVKNVLVPVLIISLILKDIVYQHLQHVQEVINIMLQHHLHHNV